MFIQMRADITHLRFGVGLNGISMQVCAGIDLRLQSEMKVTGAVNTDGAIMITRVFFLYIYKRPHTTCYLTMCHVESTLSSNNTFKP